jgi:hypothetical protein
MGDDYENMSKEQLIAEIYRLKDYAEEVNDFNEKVVAENAKLHDLLKSILFLLDNTYDNIRNN